MSTPIADCKSWWNGTNVNVVLSEVTKLHNDGDVMTMPLEWQGRNTTIFMRLYKAKAVVIQRWKGNDHEARAQLSIPYTYLESSRLDETDTSYTWVVVFKEKPEIRVVGLGSPDDVEFARGLPLAFGKIKKGTTMSFTSQITSLKFWELNQARIRALCNQDHIVALTEQQRAFLVLNNQALEAESKRELRELCSCTVRLSFLNGGLILAFWPNTDREFNIKDGEKIVLRSETVFTTARIQALSSRKEWVFVARVLPKSAKWRSMTDAPFHAQLINVHNNTEEELRELASFREEKDVQIIPWDNSYVDERNRKFMDQFEDVLFCQEFDQMDDPTLDNGLSISEIFVETEPFSSRPQDWVGHPFFRERLSPTLNANQRAAVEMIYRHPLSAVTGPPGTGKTQAMAIAALNLGRQQPPMPGDICGQADHPCKVLMVAPTLAACDALIRALARLSREPHIPEDGKPGFMRYRSRPQFQALLYSGFDSEYDNCGRMWQYLERYSIKPHRPGNIMFRNLQSGFDAIRTTGEIREASAAKRFTREYWDLLRILVTEEFKIVVTTPLQVDKVVKLGFSPQVLLVDEASCMRDIELFGIIANISSLERIQLVGDPNQLAPFTSTEEGKLAWAESLMERLIRRGVPHIMLNQQYRTSARLYSTTSTVFYGGAVQSVPPADAEEIHDTLVTNPIRVPCGNKWYTIASSICFLDVKGALTRRTPSRSYFCPFEAKLALNLARALVRGLRIAGRVRIDRCVTILCGYRGQLEYIQSLFMNDEYEYLRLCTLQTFDQSQGSENEVIIATFGRNIGRLQTFLHAPRRVNVVTSRARRALFFVGDYNWVTTSGDVGNKLRETMESYIENNPDVEFVVRGRTQHAAV